MRKTPIERFTEKYVKKLVVIDGKFLVCWIWIGGTKGPDPNLRYGEFFNGTKDVGAHRWSYEYHVGPIPKGMDIDHFKCWNSLCVNPDHLRPATRLENIFNGRNTYAVRTHCVNGHEFTPENTYVSHRLVGDVMRPRRHCKQCRRIQHQRQEAKRRETRPA